MGGRWQGRGCIGGGHGDLGRGLNQGGEDGRLSRVATIKSGIAQSNPNYEENNKYEK